MSYPLVRLFHSDHTWVLLEKSDVALIGITNFAQETLGDIIEINFSSIGDYISKGELCGTLESRKTVSEIIAPVSGVVVEVNESLSIETYLINNDCYGKGWVARIKLANPLENPKLMRENQYLTHIGE